MPFLVAGLIDAQEIKVYANNEYLGDMELNEQNFIKKSLKLPKHILEKGSILEIKFELPNAASPKELGISNDSRKLGIALKSFTIREKP